MNKPIFFLSIFIAFALGVAGMWAWQQHQASDIGAFQAAATMPDPDMALPQPLPTLADPIAEMERMREQMEAFFNHDDFFSPGLATSHFGSWFPTEMGGFGTRIQVGEDEDSVFFRLKTGDQDVSNVDVTVENGYISINAELSSKSTNTYAHSTVSESFPVPAGVDRDSAKIDKEDDAIVIRFDKMS